MTLSTDITQAGLPEIDQLLQDALHTVRTYLGLEVAFISELTSGLRIFRYVDSEKGFSPVQVGNADPLEQSYCQRVVDGRLPELMTDAQQNAEALRLPVTKQLPVGAHLSVPIHIGRDVYGTFCCFSRYPDSGLDWSDLAVVRLYAELVGRILQRTVWDQRLKLEQHQRLRHLLEQRLFQMVYQPIVHVGMNKTVGFEALTRFTAEPLRSPDHWFKEAAESGLGVELELAVIQSALSDLPKLPPDAYLSLNISPLTIMEGSVFEVLASYPLNRLMLEVTEHASIVDYGVIADKLAPYRQQGLQLAVDDAGAGYASFRHILKLKPDVIKLDSSLVAAIDKDAGIRALAAALVRFAEETGSRVVAEGVETQEELQVLRQLRVNKAQGYLLGRPDRLDTFLHPHAS